MSRLVDPGAVFAGWVGAGVALVVVIAFGLVIAIPPLVIVSAMPIGAGMGAYANVRSRRHWPRRRVMANALWAGTVTAVVLAAFYTGVRLLFLYLDTGRLPDDRQLDCIPGPDCVFARLVEIGEGPGLAQAGITSAAEFEAAMLALLATLSLLLLGATIVGAAAAGAIQALTGWSRKPGEEEAAG